MYSKKHVEWMREIVLSTLSGDLLSIICANGKIPKQGWWGKWAVQALFVFFLACVLRNGIVTLNSELTYLRSRHGVVKMYRKWLVHFFSLCLEDLYPSRGESCSPMMQVHMRDNAPRDYSADIPLQHHCMGFPDHLVPSPAIHNTLYTDRHSLNSCGEPRAGDTMLKKRDTVYSRERRSDKETSIFHRAQTGVALIRDRRLQGQIEEGYPPGPKLSGKTFWKKNV
uniref:Uncharacterized protein n=1 Tax=Myotis myotis TaxID=51298 RepID=A0A7J7UDI6_MYOMY|nr:hypothetical protein mMyoMyo1_014612 [Myotis myotis]